MTIEESIEQCVERAIAPLVTEIRQLRKDLEKFMNPPDNTVLTDRQVAELIGVSVPTIQRMKWKDRIGCIRTARGLAIRVSDVEKWKAARGSAK